MDLSRKLEATVKNCSDLADDFLDFFTGKINKIRKELEHYPLYKLQEKIEQQFSQFERLSEDDVRKLVLKAKPTNCPSDPMPANLLKKHINILLPLITRIVNLSLSNGEFAECWKVSIIRPLIKKKGLECILKNYRPVSNLSFISKLVERACLDQFMSFIENNKLLPSYQSAYRYSISEADE